MSYPQGGQEPPQHGLKRHQVPPQFAQQQTGPPGYPPQQGMGPTPPQQAWGTPPQPGWQPAQGWGPPPPPPRKKRTGLKITLGVVGAFIVLIIIGAALSPGGGSNTSNSTSSTSGSGSQTGGSPASSAPAAAATAARIGDKVRDGKFQFVVTKISHAKSVGDTGIGLGQTAQGRYVIISLTVTNIGNQSQTLDDQAQYIYDSHARKFSADSTADVYLSGANGQNSTWFQDINPGNTVHGKMAFDMPKGDAPVKIELHDSIFSDGVTVLLK